MPLHKKRLKKIIGITAALAVLMIVLFTIAAHFFVEPTLRKKIHALIVDGSKGLYTYKLGGLDASLITGDVEINDFQLNLDSNHYYYLLRQNALPSITIQASLQKAHIKNLGVVNLLFGKKITIDNILTSALNIRLMRHRKEETMRKERLPLWKSMQPTLKSISVKSIVLDSIKFLYKSKDTTTFMKLQFDRFDARFQNLQIDSAATTDTQRIFFSEDIFLRWHDLKYRTADSSYKMKAEWITYSSKNNRLQVDSFKLQPTLEKEVFYQRTGISKSLYYLEFDKIRISGFDLAGFIHNDAVIADSFVVAHPRLSIYQDKTQGRIFASKEGSFPQQQLLNASASISFRHILFRDGTVTYTVKDQNTRQDGRLQLTQLNVHMQNATNDSGVISANSVCTVQADAQLMGSPMNAVFTFYLDSSNARFDVKGTVKNMTAAQLNQLSVPMANIYLPSLQLHELNFFIRGEEWTTWTDVDMRYNHLALVMRQMNERGGVETKGYLTRLLNQYVVHPSNPGPEGIERHAKNVKFMRLTTQAFFGVIWKSLFAGIQGVVMKTGRIES